jgi:hypothetical protein
MPNHVIKLQTGPMNTSFQKGDILYYTPYFGAQAGTNHPLPTSGINTKPQKLGKVIAIDPITLKITVQTPGPLPNLTDTYLFFIKDAEVNHSGIIGAWLEVEYRNYSKISSEIFATATDFVESSR